MNEKIKKSLENTQDDIVDSTRRYGSSISNTEVQCIKECIRDNNYREILNIGTFNGWSIIQISQIPNIHIDTVDYAPADKDDRYLVSEEGSSYSAGGNRRKYENLVKYLKDRKIGNIDLYICGSDEFFKNNKKIYDFIFIDGDHSYEVAKRDLYNSLKCIKKDGLIYIHDTIHFKGLPEHRSCVRVYNEYEGKKKRLRDIRKKTLTSIGVIYP